MKKFQISPNAVRHHSARPTQPIELILMERKANETVKVLLILDSNLNGQILSTEAAKAPQEHIVELTLLAKLPHSRNYSSSPEHIKCLFRPLRVILDAFLLEPG